MKKSLVACILSAALVASSPASAALNAFLSLSGQKQGQIRGSVTQKGREDKIRVFAVEHAVKNELGSKKHGVLTISKELDKSTPLLYQALATGELITRFELQFWTPQARAGVGAETQHYTVRLTNARITGIKFVMPNNRDPELAKHTEYEEVSFTYDSITWTWTDGNISATDTRDPREPR